MRVSTRAVLASVALLLVMAFSSAAKAASSPSFVVWVYYVPYDRGTSLPSLRGNCSHFTVVSPYYYQIDGNGRISGQADPEVDSLVRSCGARLIPMIKNNARYADFSPVLNDPARRAQAVQAVSDLVLAGGYDGIHIDFEALRGEDSDGLNQFMAALKARLSPTGKLTTMAISPKNEDTDSGWAGVYDFRTLAAHADYLVLMSYGYRTSSNPTPGAYAPLPLVERGLNYAVSQIPSAKLLLGLGLWGYDWNVSSPQAASTRSYPETMALAQRFAGTLGYADSEQTAVLRYQSNGQAHEVWFENQRSAAAKVSLARRYGLAGVAGWRLGHEDPAIWSLFEAAAPDPAPDPSPDGDKGHFFTETGGGQNLGYWVRDAGIDAQGQTIRFWSEFQRLGGVATLGYPVSRRFIAQDGFTYQVFQRGVLQWRPEVNQAYLSNTFEQLTAAGKDGYLQSLGIPPPIADDGSNGDWVRARAIRLSWLTEPTIAQAFRNNPNPQAITDWSEDSAINLYGLPASRPIKSGPFVVQRFQRISLQLWLEDVPGMPAKGSVVGILGGDLLKEQGLVPAEAMAPETP